MLHISVSKRAKLCGKSEKYQPTYYNVAISQRIRRSVVGHVCEMRNWHLPKFTADVGLRLYLSRRSQFRCSKID